MLRPFDVLGVVELFFRYYSLHAFDIDHTLIFIGSSVAELVEVVFDELFLGFVSLAVHDFPHLHKVVI